MKELARSSFRCLLVASCILMLGNFIDLTPARSQGVSSAGTDFWVGFMPNFVGGRNVTQLFIASGTSNLVKVTVNKSTTSYKIAANTAITVDLQGAGVTRSSETISDQSVHVTSTAPITMYGYDVWDGGAGFLGGSPDGFLALPTAGLGTKYYTVNYYDAKFAGTPTVGEYVVVATQDNTNVTFTTKAHTRGPSGMAGHNTDDTWTTSLMKGQTYMVQSTGNYIGTDDLSGSLVTSNHPIALLSGHQISPIDVQESSADHLLEMVPPVDKWGTQYFDMPMAGRTVCGDYIRILSGEDGNKITYNGNGPLNLDAGAWAEIPTVTVPEVFTSINGKKFLTIQYSYSQGYQGDPGTADPFMILMTPQEQFEKRMIFRTPLPAKNGSFNNYLTCITLLDSIYTIKINGLSITSYGTVGQKTFSNTNPVMAAIRVKLPAGSNSYLATANVPFGMYQYGFSSYEGYGWPTGMALNISSPDTLPPFQDTVATCGNYTVKLREFRHIPSFSFEDTRIAEVSQITEPGDPRWAKPSFNYLFVLDPNFNAGDSTATFTLNIIDPTKDAYAAVYTVDRAGNDTVYQYSYSAPKLSFAPAPDYVFMPVTVDQDSCKTITIKNIQASGSLDLTNLQLEGTAKGGKFTYTPNALKSLNPGESVQVTVCYSPTDTGKAMRSFDTLIFNSNCPQQRLPLVGEGVTPLIFAEDLDFGIVDSAQTKCLPLKITNKGTAVLKITKDQLPNTVDFTVTGTFPIVLKPGESITLNACFHPSRTGTFTTTDLFTTNNPLKFARSIKDTSVLIGRSFRAGARLTSYQESFLALCSQTPTIVDTVFDPEHNADQIISADITGPDAASFAIVSFTPGNGSYPVQLDPLPSPGVFYTLRFDPTVKGMLSGVRTATLNVHTQSGVVLTATLTADSKTPVLAVTPGSAQTLDLGTVLISQSKTGQFTVTNTGNDVLNVGTIVLSGADAAFFNVTPPGGYTLAPGASQIETVTFTAGTAARQYDVIATVNPANNPCAILKTQVIKAAASSTGYTVQGADYQTTYTCKNKDSSSVFMNLSSSETATIVSAVVSNVNGWTNASDFAQTPAGNFPITVPPGATITLPVKFSPTATGMRKAGLVYTFTTPKGTQTLTAALSGVGANVAEIVGVGTTSTLKVYQGHASDVVNVPIIISQPFQTATNEVYGYDFSVSWFEDAFRLENPTSIQAPNGVTVKVASDIVDATTHIESFVFHGVSQNPLTNETQLANLVLTAKLDASDSTGLVLNSVSFNDKNGNALCYITTSTVNSTFDLTKLCGDSTVQRMLRGTLLPLDISLPEPNPMRTMAKLAVTVRTANAVVSVRLFDALGNEVATIVNQQSMTSGLHQIPFDASHLSSGAYFLRVSDGTNTATRRVLVQK
jgi:hypothetical protein